MATSDFWRDLAAQFRALPDSDTLRAEWDYVLGKPYRWTFAGGRSELHSQFEALARRGGAELTKTEFSDSLVVWLDAVMKFGRDIIGHGYYDTQNPDGSDGPRHMTGRIDRVCERSADFCNILESEELQREFEEKQRNDPRNWSPLKQRYEAFKSMKKLITGPHEEIPEAFVRNVLAEQYG